MEDMAATHTLRTIGFMDENPLCEGGAAAARRRRLEIIRFKQFITTGTAAFPEPEPKVKRSKRSMTSQSYHASRSQASEELAEDISSSANNSVHELLGLPSPLDSAPASSIDVVTCGGDNTSSRNDAGSLKPAAAIVDGLESPQGEGVSALSNPLTLQEGDTDMLSGEDGDTTPAASQASGAGEQQETSVSAGDLNLVSASSSGSSSSSECPPHGLVSVCGRRRAMEDFVAVVPSFMSAPCGVMGGCFCDPTRKLPEINSSFHFFGVYDGHGGPQVAQFCADRLHQALAEEVQSTMATVESGEAGATCRDELWLRAMSSCFQRVDEEVGGVGLADSSGGTRLPAEPIAPEMVGSTAVVAVVGSCQIVVGNCGDSRAVLSRGGKAIALSCDHKPERKDELARIEAAGGRVISWGGYRVLGVLAMSRAIGDRYLKPYVISEPEVTCTQRTEDDECLVLASDGLWDVIPNETVCEVARKCLAGRHSSRASGSGRGEDGSEESPCSVAAALLMKLAFAKGSNDNISVVVVDLKAGR